MDDNYTIHGTHQLLDIDFLYALYLEYYVNRDKVIFGFFIGLLEKNTIGETNIMMGHSKIGQRLLVFPSKHLFIDGTLLSRRFQFLELFN
jgi:hypothetical protein